MQESLSSFKKKTPEQEKKQKLLDNIKSKLLKELVCPLRDEANNLVFGKGNPDADILFIGEAPGEKEDLQGIPFIGRAGKELDQLLHSINLSLEDVYIANILKYRPPKNRDPKKEEIISHTPYLIEQIKAINPKVICTLGNFSTKFVLSKFNPEEMKKIDGVSELHGKPIDIKINKLNFKVVPLYHPAAMLYRPKLRGALKKDFKKINKVIKDVKKDES
ncbi:uracil-DNA glycosylase [Candidatus Woesearchaeota archaeon]|nr:uracil-DNA glycosylase [Candidatus Woesearchaeota archaeon]